MLHVADKPTRLGRERVGEQRARPSPAIHEEQALEERHQLFSPETEDGWRDAQLGPGGVPHLVTPQHGQGVEPEQAGAPDRLVLAGGERGPQPAFAEHVGQQRQLAVREAFSAEPRQPPRNGDAGSRAQPSQRAPALLGEERMAERGADDPPEAGPHPEDRFDPVVDEGRRGGHDHAPVPRVEAHDLHPLARRPAAMELCAVTSSPVAGSSSSVSHATHLPMLGRAPTTFRVEGWSPFNSSSRSV